jgi:hypothetical protein
MGDDSMMQGQGDVDMSESAGTAGMEGMDKVDLAAEIEKARNVHGWVGFTNLLSLLSG